jgi:hypothetical protein
MEVKNDPAYEISCHQKRLGEMIQIRDDIHTPLERAVYWTEYVMRHPGAQHLQSPTRCKFHQHFIPRFYVHRSQKRKKRKIRAFTALKNDVKQSSFKRKKSENILSLLLLLFIIIIIISRNLSFVHFYNIDLILALLSLLLLVAAGLKILTFK